MEEWFVDPTCRCIWAQRGENLPGWRGEPWRLCRQEGGWGGGWQCQPQDWGAVCWNSDPWQAHLWTPRSSSVLSYNHVHLCIWRAWVQGAKRVCGPWRVLTCSKWRLGHGWSDHRSETKAVETLAIRWAYRWLGHGIHGQGGDGGSCSWQLTARMNHRGILFRKKHGLFSLSEIIWTSVTNDED